MMGKENLILGKIEISGELDSDKDLIITVKDEDFYTDEKDYYLSEEQVEALIKHLNRIVYHPKI